MMAMAAANAAKTRKEGEMIFHRFVRWLASWWAKKEQETAATVPPAPQAEPATSDQTQVWQEVVVALPAEYLGRCENAALVVLETNGIKIADDDGLYPYILRLKPEVPSRFFLGAWREFCRESGFEPSDVTFGNGRRLEEGLALLDVRNRCRIDQRTRTASTVFSDLLVAGLIAVEVRFTPEKKAAVELFLRCLDRGYLRLGRSRTIYGWVRVAEVRPIA